MSELKEILIKVYVIIVVCVILMGIAYLIGSAAHLSFNLVNWSPTTRGLFAIWDLIVLVVVSFAIVLSD